MSILPPLNQNCVEARSEIPFYISNQAFSDSIISDVKNWTYKKNYKPEMVNTISKIAITVFACATMICLPKIAAFGSVAVVAFIYHKKLAKIVENKKDLLLTTSYQKIIEYLSSPDLNKKALGSLKSYNLSFYNHDSFSVKECLEVLKESPSKEKLRKKYEEVSVALKKITQTMRYFRRDFLGPLGPLGSLVEKPQLDLLLEDLTPLINAINKNNSTLKEIKKILESLEENSLKADFLNLNTTILRDQEDLSKKLNALQKNIPFFKENGTLLNKTTKFFLEFDSIILNKAKAYKDFIFYSLTTAALIKANVFFIKQFNQAHWLDRGGSILNLIGHSTVIALGVLSIGHVIVKTRELMAHGNDEAKKQIELATIIEEEGNRLDLLLEQA